MPKLKNYLLLGGLFLLLALLLGYLYTYNAEASQVRKVIEQGWSLRLAAGLEKNRAQWPVFEEKLRQYFSDKPRPPSLRFQWRGEGKSSDDGSPLSALSPSASEWEVQKAYVENGRYNQEKAHFWVDECRVQKFDFKRIQIRGLTARAVVDIIFWCKISYVAQGQYRSTRPVGGEHHIFILRKEAGIWKIVNDTFTIIPGYEP